MPSFIELGLNPLLIQAVEALGFKEPMPVQAEVIPILVSNPVDLVGLAQTGTGKTAAFGLPVLHHIDANLHKTQALVLCPTRELCLQISRDLTSYAKFMPSVRITAVYGGASIDTQIRQLDEGPQVIVATPGRLNDMIRRKRVDFSMVKWVILDEADEMLDMGFQEEVDTILETTPDDKFTLLFSATMPAQVERILAKYMTNPVVKTVGKRNAGTANVKHMYYMVPARDRYQALKRLADFNPDIYAIIFCRTRIETQEIAESLIRDGYNADSLHGDLSQAQRDHVMGRFRSRALQMLVATDVAARGLDVSDLTHVINYNLPDDTEIYIHRSGRTGRADKLGISISIINLKEKYKIRQIEKMIGREFSQAKIPTGVQVCEKQLFHYIDRMENVEIDKEIDSFIPVISHKLEGMERDEIIKRFVSLEFNRFLEYYRNAKDLNIIEDERKAGRDSDGRDRGRDGGRDSYRDRGDHERGSRDRGSREGGREGSRDRGRNREGIPERDKDLTRMFLSVGRKDRILPTQIIGLINEVTRSREIRVGRIDILDSYSFVDIDSNSVDKVLNAFSNPGSNPDGIRIEKASERDDASSTPYKRSSKGDDSSDSPYKRSPRRESSSDRPYKKRSEKSSDSSDSPYKRSPKGDYDGPEGKKKPFNDQPSFESPWNRAPRRNDSSKGDSRRGDSSRRSDSHRSDSHRGKRK